ncbi:MAG: VWA domain-containing protein [Desulfotignum sp.]|nr:VWA domain-containing protein [Desulfotignum sp.]MCF8087282.1 VWA domain-containing protein [Desulfotignum sp.]MCF8136686.1 VWA domain-containing protein [Desulfotignum sp.]
MNAVCREPTASSVKLKPEDFEVFERAALERSSTVLMVDLSFSMLARDHFEAAKRVAMALDSLIRSQYPKDSLYIVGFANSARQLKKEDLSYIQWGESDNYTNIQHGLYLARKLLAKERQTNQQIILVTDGEPTAHFEDETHFFCQAPPSPRTLQLTLQEVRNCTRKGIVINTFMLENDKFLTAFVTRMARINKGRVFFASSDTLGQYLLVDYMANKKRTI